MLGKDKKAVKCIVLVFFIILFTTCNEEIPEGPPRVQVAEGVISTAMERLDFPQPTNYDNRYERPPFATDWALLTDNLVRFRFKVHNIFDETIDGLKWIDVKLNLWSINYLRGHASEYRRFPYFFPGLKDRMMLWGTEILDNQTSAMIRPGCPFQTIE